MPYSPINMKCFVVGFLFAAALAVMINMLAQCIDSNDIWIQSIGSYFWIIIALPFAVCWSTSEQPSDTYEDLSNRDTQPQMEVMQLTKPKQISHL